MYGFHLERNLKTKLKMIDTGNDYFFNGYNKIVNFLMVSVCFLLLMDFGNIRIYFPEITENFGSCENLFNHY